MMNHHVTLNVPYLDTSGKRGGISRTLLLSNIVYTQGEIWECLWSLAIAWHAIRFSCVNKVALATIYLASQEFAWLHDSLSSSETAPERAVSTSQPFVVLAFLALLPVKRLIHSVR